MLGGSSHCVLVITPITTLVESHQSYCRGFQPFISLGSECSIFELRSMSPKIVSVFDNRLS